MEFVVIINLSPNIASDLNQRTKDGLQIVNGVHNFRELNCCTDLHGRIESRVFYAQDVHPNEKYVLVLGKLEEPEKVKEFIIPTDKEYIILDLD